MANRPTQQFIKGQTILLEGTPGDRTFRILAGEVIICKKGENGEQVPIAKLGAGEMFGEMYLFDHGLARTATAIALSNDVSVEVFAQEEVKGMLSGLHPSINRIFEGLSLRLQKISGKYVQTVSKKTVAQPPETPIKPADSYIHRPLE